MVGRDDPAPDPKGSRASSRPSLCPRVRRQTVKLTDAAIWEIEMGTTSPGTALASGPYRRFAPVFDTLPWLHKARLQVVDRQAGKKESSWIVVQDIEDPSVYLLLGAAGRYQGASLVRPVNPNFTAPSGTEAGNWELRGRVASPQDLLRAIRLKLGRGRHVG